MTTALECRSVTRRFGQLVAVDSVSLVVESGRRHAVIGPNGAGKSTFFNLLAGTLRPTSGTVHLLGQDVTKRSDAWRSCAGLAKTFQHSSLFLSMSLHDNVALAVQRVEGDGMRLRGATGRAQADQVSGLLADVGLVDRSRDRVQDLSHGERRQLEVAVALATRPQLLLLDEPTAGMSAAESGRFAELVESLPRTITVLLIEHDLDVVFRLAERITVLHLGAVLADGAPEEVRADPAVQAAYLGTGRSEPLWLPARRKARA